MKRLCKNFGLLNNAVTVKNLELSVFSLRGSHETVKARR